MLRKASLKEEVLGHDLKKSVKFSQVRVLKSFQAENMEKHDILKNKQKLQFCLFFGCNKDTCEVSYLASSKSNTGTRIQVRLSQGTQRGLWERKLEKRAATTAALSSFLPLWGNGNQLYGS